MFIALWILCLPQVPAADAPISAESVAPAPPAVVDFAKEVRPLLQAACFDCHGADRSKGDVRLDLREHVFPGDRDAWLVVPGVPEDSVLFDVVTRASDDPERMPKDAEPLTPEQVELLRRWIRAGATWPDGVDDMPRPAREPDLELDAEQRARRDRAIERLVAANVRAHPLARDAAAVEVRFAAWRDPLDRAALELLDGLQPCLTHLDVAGTAIDDTMLDALVTFGELRVLDLASSAIGDEGVVALARLERLTTLNLVGTRVSDASVESLLRIPALRRLYVWNTAMTSAAIARMRAERPELVIDDGESAARFRELVHRSRAEPAKPDPAQPSSAEPAPAQPAPEQPPVPPEHAPTGETKLKDADSRDGKPAAKPDGTR